MIRREQRPCLRELKRLLALPLGVFGPVDRLEFSRFARSLASEMGVPSGPPFSFLGSQPISRDGALPTLISSIIFTSVKSLEIYLWKCTNSSTHDGDSR